MNIETALKVCKYARIVSTTSNGDRKTSNRKGNGMRLDPRIGTLNSGKFYAYPNDAYDKPPVIGSLEQVETALGLRQPTPIKKQKSQIQWRDYIVTVTPQFKVYCGDWSNGEYTATIHARSHAEAIKKEREEYNAREGRGQNGVPVKFKARLAKEQEQGE